MRLDFHHFYHPDQETAERLRRIENMLGVIQRMQDEIMATNEDLEALLADIDVKVSNIAADQDRLLALLAVVPAAGGGGLTPEQQAAFDAAVAHATAIRDKLADVDAKA